MDSSYVSSLLLWTFLPSLVTRFVLAAVYAVCSTFNRRFKRPPSGSAKHKSHYRLVFTVAIAAYFLSETAQSVSSLPENHYSRFQLSPSAYPFPQRQLKTAYRRISLKYHPDKQQQSSEGNSAVNTEEIFVQYRHAHDILNDPSLRWVYDRLGDEAVTECSTCKSQQEYFWNAFPTQLAGYYAGIMLMLGIIQAIAAFSPSSSSSSSSGGRQTTPPLGTMFWRYWGVLLALAVELWMIGSVRDPLGWLIPSMTVAEKIQVWRKLYLSTMLGLTHVLPFWTPVDASSIPLGTLVERVLACGEIRRKELAMEMQIAWEPFINTAEQSSSSATAHNSTALRERLTQKMERLMIDMQLFEQDSEFQQALKRSNKKSQ